MNAGFAHDDDNHTGCGSCGECFFSITSTSVKDISLRQIQSGIWFTLFLYEQCLQYAPTVMCSLEHTRVDCAGRVFLGLVRVSDRSIANVVRDLYGKYYEPSRAHEYRERHFVEVPRGQRYTPISAEQVFVHLVRNWNSHRMRYGPQAYDEVVSKRTLARLCEVEARKLPLMKCSICIVPRSMWRVS